jgi:hypothetical protein
MSDLIFTLTENFTAVSGCTVTSDSVIIDPFVNATLADHNASLITCLPFNNYSTDVIGSNAATLVNGATYANGGPRSGKMLSLTAASSQYAALPDNCLNAYNSGTIRLFIYSTSLPSTPTFFNAGSSSTNIFLLIRGYDGKIDVYTPSNNIRTTDVVLSNSTLHEIVMTSNGSEWKVYLDGVEKETEVITGSNTGTWFGDVGGESTQYSIGCYRYTFAPDGLGFHNGLISDVEIYSSVWDATDVLTAYNSGTPILVHDHDATFWIHNDAASLEIDLGSYPALDLSTSLEFLENGTTLYQYDSDNVSGFTPTLSSQLSITELREEPINSDQYYRLLCTMSSIDGLQSIYNKLTINTYGLAEIPKTTYPTIPLSGFDGISSIAFTLTGNVTNIGQLLRDSLNSFIQAEIDLGNPIHLSIAFLVPSSNTNGVYIGGIGSQDFLISVGGTSEIYERININDVYIKGTNGESVVIMLSQTSVMA